MRRLSHVMAFDDAPFERSHRGDVPVVGVAFSGLRLAGLVTGRVRRDGANATRELARLVETSRFSRQTQVILLQGIALAGFNVVDVHGLAARLGRPVVVVARGAPDVGAIERALAKRVPGGARKWRLVRAAGPMEPCAGVWVQRAGIELADAARLVQTLAVEGRIPEPLRVAHLFAGALATGHSRGRA